MTGLAKGEDGLSNKEIQVPLGLTVDGLIARRYFARLIDSVVILVLVGIEAALLSGMGIGTASTAGGLLALGVVLMTFMTYGGVMESSAWQATVGKKILGMRVYGTGGGRISFGQALARNLAKDVPFVVLGVLPFGQLLGFAWLCAHLVVVHRSPVYQAIHDRVAGTLIAAPEQTVRLNLSV